MLYSGAPRPRWPTCAGAAGIPVAETQAGRGALGLGPPASLGAIGVTGTSAANAAAAAADVVLAVGTRLQDFTTGSRALFPKPQRLSQVNINAFDATSTMPSPSSATLARCWRAAAELGGYRAPGSLDDWVARPSATRGNDAWSQARTAAREQRTSLRRPGHRRGRAPGAATTPRWSAPPAVFRASCTSSGGRSARGGYHVEYGFSCMGYEIAGGLGVKLADPGREVVVMVGDGSYLMLNSEIATSVMLGLKLTIVVLDNRGFGCINRLQQSAGGAPFNNLLADSRAETLPDDRFRGPCRQPRGAIARKWPISLALYAALERATRRAAHLCDRHRHRPRAATSAGGAWWDVAVPEVSGRPAVRAARADYETAPQGAAGVT